MEEPTNFQPTALRLMDQVRAKIRYKRYSLRTEQSYLGGIRRYILYHNKCHTSEMGAIEIESFLTHLAVKRKVSVSTQNLVLNAILFLYREVLQLELPWLDGFERAKKPKRLPVVLSKEEVRRILAAVSNLQHRFILSLLYGTGMRVMECVRLRIKDIDMDRLGLVVRHGKGGKDRVTVVPEPLLSQIVHQFEKSKILFEEGRANQVAGIYTPGVLDAKYPNAGKEFGWHWVFPSSKLSIDPRTGIERRHHMDEKAIQRSMRSAVKKAGIYKHATPHTLRHYKINPFILPFRPA